MPATADSPIKAVLFDCDGVLADTERDIARLVVGHLQGNRTRAAEVLGISRTTLWRLLKDDDR